MAYHPWVYHSTEWLGCHFDQGICGSWVSSHGNPRISKGTQQISWEHLAVCGGIFRIWMSSKAIGILYHCLWIYSSIEEIPIEYFGNSPIAHWFFMTSPDLDMSFPRPARLANPPEWYGNGHDREVRVIGEFVCWQLLTYWTCWSL